ncbi:MAG: AraC family transcriptional regulator [Elusimicrobia bacterium]|nr:AraC family transcriptional regulator [Elusimicrobiota bacterium]
MGMKRYTIPVHEALKPYLRYCAVKTTTVEKDESIVESSTQADIWPSLVVLRGPAIKMTDAGGKLVPVPRVTFMGASEISGAYEVPDGSQLIGFNFHPGKAHPFFGSSLAEFTNKIVPLHDAWGKEGALYEERIEAAESPLAVKKIVEEALLHRLAEFHGFPDALPEPLGAAIGSSGSTTVGELAAQGGCSERHLKRLFDQWVGLSPKIFSRIVRFQALVEALTPAVEPDWAGLAFEQGYFDQSHLIRDFKDFAGTSPERFYDGAMRPATSDAAAWKHMQPEGLSLTPAR